MGKSLGSFFETQCTYTKNVISQHCHVYQNVNIICSLKKLGSYTSLSDHLNTFQLFICQSSVFDDFYHIYHTQS